MNFINYAEMAGYLSDMAETEVTKTESNGVTTTTIYAGTPFRATVNDTPPFQQNANGDLLQDGGSITTVERWKIRRTVVVDNGTTTTVTNKWAEGAWDNRASLTYQYL